MPVISKSRVRHILNKEVLNVEYEDCLKELEQNNLSQSSLTLLEELFKHSREEKSSKKSKSSKKRKKNFSSLKKEDKVKLITTSKLKYRFSREVAPYVAGVAEYVVDYLLREAVKGASRDNKSTLQIEHVFWDYLNVPTSLIEHLPIIRDNVKELVETKSLKEDKIDSKSAYNFKFYVKELCRIHKDFKLSKSLNEFLSEVAVQLIMNIGNLLRVYVKKNNCKTISRKMVELVVELLHVNSKDDTKSLEEYIKNIEN